MSVKISRVLSAFKCPVGFATDRSKVVVLMLFTFLCSSVL